MHFTCYIVLQTFNQQRFESNRATDSLRDIVKKYQLPELRPSYYLSAMDLFVEKFPKKKFNVIFVLVMISFTVNIAWQKLIPDFRYR